MPNDKTLRDDNCTAFMAALQYISMLILLSFGLAAFSCSFIMGDSQSVVNAVLCALGIGLICEAIYKLCGLGMKERSQADTSSPTVAKP